MGILIVDNNGYGENDWSILNTWDAGELEEFDLTVPNFDLQDKNIDPANSAPLSPPVDYVAEMTVLGTNVDFVDQLAVKAYDVDCANLIDLNNNIVAEGITNLTLKSRGTYNKSEQTIVAQILPKDPASGILGFVLFSDQDITK